MVRSGKGLWYFIPLSLLGTMGNLHTQVRSTGKNDILGDIDAVNRNLVQ
jgi:hypothetical protein